MAVIFVNIPLDELPITGGSFTVLLLMAVGSTMLTISIVAPQLRRLGNGVATVVATAPASYAAGLYEHKFHHPQRRRHH